jgi:hypothetical protein
MTDLDIDPDKRREELIEETEAAKRQHEQELTELTQAVKNDEELEHDQYDWVEVGDVEMKVKAWLPGDTMDTLEEYSEADESGSMPPISDIVDIAISQTEVIRSGDVSWSKQSQIQAFWEKYYEEQGDTVLEVALNRVLDPALDKRQGRVPDGFRQKRDG